MGETVLKARSTQYPLKIRYQESGEDGAYQKCLWNLCPWSFDRKMWQRLLYVLGEKKGIDVSQMTGIDFAAFKETQYDILAAELRKHLDMKKILRNSGEGI